jgi:hypothetical protein
MLCTVQYRLPVHLHFSPHRKPLHRFAIPYIRKYRLSYVHPLPVFDPVFYLVYFITHPLTPVVTPSLVRHK